jgi:hypothetical protein
MIEQHPAMLIVEFPGDIEVGGIDLFSEEYAQKILKFLQDLTTDGRYVPVINAHGEHVLAVTLPEDLEAEILSKESGCRIWNECKVFTEFYEADFFFVSKDREVFRMLHTFTKAPELLPMGRLEFVKNPQGDWDWQSTKYTYQWKVVAND